MISKPTRGGLAALVLGLVIAVFFAAQFFAATSVHAQAPAEAPAAAAPAAETPPACDAKTLEKCTPNSGDTAWMLTSVALVPESQLWTLTEPDSSRIQRGLGWAAETQPQETDVDALLKQRSKRAGRRRARR